MLIRQQHEILATDVVESDVARQWARLWSNRLGSASQVQQVIFDNPNDCAQSWASWVAIDIRFATAFTVNPLRDRIIVTLKSASAAPTCVCSGANVHELSRWDSPTPANFGGDGHGYWAVYYVVPTSVNIDFSGTTGAGRMANFFTCAGDLPSGSGNYGDGVAIIFTDQQEYVLTFGTATAEVSVSQAALPQDAVFMWADGEVRTIDDIDFEREFHTEDTSIFNDDVSAHNVGITEEDAYLDGRDPRDAAMTVTMRFDVTATALVFPGSCRVLAWAFGADLRALC